MIQPYSWLRINYKAGKKRRHHAYKGKVDDDDYRGNTTTSVESQDKIVIFEWELREEAIEFYFR